MAKTSYLGIELTGTTQTDVSQTFQTWRQKINGLSDSSAMNIIDSAVRDLHTAIENITDSIDTISTVDIDNVTRED